MASLDHDLSSGCPSSTARTAILEAFWGYSPGQQFTPLGQSATDYAFDAYFKFYMQQCDLIGLHENGKYSSARTHRHIVEVAKVLKQNLTREQVRHQLPRLLGDATQEQHDNSINLVSRLLVMLQFGEVPHEWSGSKPISWVDASLSDVVRSHFSQPPALGHERVKFEKIFNALGLVRISGIEIRWTDNLAEHLRLINDDTVVCVFHHVSFLRQQVENPMFPEGFVEETLRSIALLMPKYDKDIRRWHDESLAEKHLDPCVIDVGHLLADERQMESFRYWHDRLVVLKQVFDESRPSTLSQWWYDRRNGVQWYTFWVAIIVLALTVFFGLVQSLEGALQVWKAFNPS
ncbi:hypothetical protein GQ53DRAFT_734312 [Thozetella sp. PMI_491]|nr:hypothetical protein GQ53DRAFT_734312 [Thozetella sp. PMI_491]